MDIEDHIGFFVLAGVDLLAVIVCAIALTWAAIRDGRNILPR